MHSQRGLTYLGLLFTVVLLGLAVGKSVELWRTSLQREREQELRWVGMQYRLAIQRYYLSTPSGAYPYPSELDELLQDSRYPTVRRHLRQLYADPMTGQADWELVRTPQRGISGVRSRSDKRPIKQSGFRPQEAEFEGAQRYGDWQFVHVQPDVPKKNQ